MQEFRRFSHRLLRNHGLFLQFRQTRDFECFQRYLPVVQPFIVTIAVSVGENLVSALVMGRYVVDNVSLPPQAVVIDSLAFEELDEVMLRDARQNVASTVNGEVGAPRQSQIELDVSRMFVAELDVPELEGRDGRRVVDVEVAQLGDRWLRVDAQLLVHAGLKDVRCGAGVVRGRADGLFGRGRVLTQHPRRAEAAALRAIWPEMALRVGQRLR